MNIDFSPVHEAVERVIRILDVNTIPPITDPLGRSWEQPKREDIVVYDKVAYMSERSLNKLAEYSSSIPTGKYHGKMWKCKRSDGWYLVWYGFDRDPKFLSINYRKVIIK